MRKLLLLSFIFIIPACALGPRGIRQANIDPTNPAAPIGTKEASVPSATVASPKTSPGDLRGIYVASYGFPHSANQDTALTSALAVPGVDGLYMVIGWDVLEPSLGQYDWSDLDQWMKAAAKASKHVELAIPAEHETPAWLFQPAPSGGGAKPLDFSFPRKSSDTTCLKETLAAPWDPAFLEQWKAMLTAVSDHLKSSGLYNDITLVRLTGINMDSDELHLPTQSSSSLSCATDSVAVWQQAGYRPSLLLKAWDAITDDFKQSFPDKTFSVAIIASAAPFPPIAEDGSLIKGKVTGQSLPLVTLAAQKLPGQLVIQNNSLYPDEPAQSETIQDAQNLHTLLAFQTNEDIRGQGASCGVRTGGDRTTPCTESTFLNELETGIFPLGKSNPLRASYIEVFPLNVNAQPNAIQQAHNELVANP